LASKAQYDILGIVVVAFMTAFGGGVVRDILVDKIPFIFHTSYPIGVVFVTLIVAYIFKLHKHTKLTDNRVFIISDSIGLSVFAFTGASVALEAGFNIGGVVFLSFLTAVGGGIIRDMMMNKVPFVLTNDFYGTIAILEGIIIYVLYVFHLLNSLSSLFVLLIAVIIRLLAVKYEWKLPVLIDKD